MAGPVRLGLVGAGSIALRSPLAHISVGVVWVREVDAATGVEPLQWVLYTVVALHVLAALKHHFMLKDNVLKRMLPFTKV